MVELASFWVGDPLGPIEIASIKSFLRHGDSITVFSPHALELPEGAKWRDANEIYPSETIIRHRKTGSAALHSDLFRYALMAKTDMIWVDLDVIALRKFDFESEWVFGWESHSSINGAVLRLPKDSHALAALLNLQPEFRGLPEYMSGFRRFRYHLKGLGKGLTIDRWPWGAIGPRAATHYLKKTGEISYAMPVSAFYSVPLVEASRFVTPGALSLAQVSPDAWGVHLWAKELRHIIATEHGGGIPEGSFLDLALTEQL
ncbi:MAG: hypothetical protein H3C51_11930 [Rubellimicrobium sp.]|nr:hypothetical protein [Rubellimicrobium sp.]